MWIKSGGLILRCRFTPRAMRSTAIVAHQKSETMPPFSQSP
jgi:hypothetical protein